MKLDPVQRQILTWGAFGLAIVAVGYALIKYVLPRIVGGVGASIGNTTNALLGGLSKNDLTQGGSADFGGNPIDYSGAGPVGNVAAVENKLTGGVLASAGETLGDTLFSVFGPTDTSPKIFYRVLFPDGSYHAVGDTWIDANNRFTFAGERFRIGDDGSGNKIATRVSTVYGSGAG